MKNTEFVPKLYTLLREGISKKQLARDILATILIALTFSRITSKIPGSIVAIVLSTAIVYFLELPVETIESKYGEIPNRLSLPALPHIDFDIIQELIQPAIAIALLGSIESLLSAVVADGMIGGRHRSNMELVAQGTVKICLKRNYQKSQKVWSFMRLMVLCFLVLLRNFRKSCSTSIKFRTS